MSASPSSRAVRWSLRTLAAVVLIGAGIGLGLVLAGRSSPAKAEDDILYWYDPMVPDQHFDKAGKSPFMDMDLVPRRRGEAVSTTDVRIDPAVTQNLGVRTAAVIRESLSVTTKVSAVIAYNERDVAVIEAKQGGFVARSYRRAPGDVIAAGDPLVDLRVPEWTGALADYVALRGDARLAAAARQRLDLLGVPAPAIRATEASGQAATVFTVTAPISGAITRLDARDGMTLPAGAPIAAINGLSPIWLIASAPQSAAATLEPGATASVRIPGAPGEALTGSIESLLPAANAAARAVEVRIALPNPGGRLRPGMSAEVTLSGLPRNVLSVPSEAVIRTGTRTLVIVQHDQRRFQPADVTVGAISLGRAEILSGLVEGEIVVASGQFLIDSEASLAGVTARLNAPVPGAHPEHSARGRVTAINDQAVTFAHDPVASLDWPAMTMQFAWGADGRAANLTVGDEAEFRFHEEGGGYVIDSVTRAGAPR